MHHSRGKSKNSKISAAPKQKISYEKKVDPAITEYSVRALNWLRKAEFLMSAPKLNLCVEAFLILIMEEKNTIQSTLILQIIIIIIGKII